MSSQHKDFPITESLIIVLSVDILMQSAHTMESVEGRHSHVVAAPVRELDNAVIPGILS